MAAVAFTKVVATDNQIVYSWTGDAAGTLSYATLAADVGATSTLGKIVASLAGECDTNAKAVAALQTGAGFVGLVTAKVVTNIQCNLVYTASTSAKYPGFVNATQAGNSPQLVVTAEAASTGFLYLTHVHSIVQ